MLAASPPHCGRVRGCAVDVAGHYCVVPHAGVVEHPGVVRHAGVAENAGFAGDVGVAEHVGVIENLGVAVNLSVAGHSGVFEDPCVDVDLGVAVVVQVLFLFSVSAHRAGWSPRAITKGDDAAVGADLVLPGDLAVSSPLARPWALAKLVVNSWRFAVAKPKGMTGKAGDAVRWCEARWWQGIEVFVGAAIGMGIMTGQRRM